MSDIAERMPDEPDPSPRCHEAIPFSGHDGFVSTAAQLISAGAAEGHACLLLAEPFRISAVRTELAGDRGAATATSYFDMSVQGRNPARVLPALSSFVASHPHTELCIVSDPMPLNQPAAVRAEVELVEWTLGVLPCRDWPASIWCLYDEDLESSARAVLTDCHRSPRGDSEADAVLRAKFRQPLSPAPRDARRLSADLTTLGELRRSVARFAATGGLDDERIDDLVYAVNEVVTNSICHGEGRARVLVWAETDAVFCQVDDGGRISDPLVGRVAPRPGRASGRGLWLVNQLCDLVQVRSSAVGTTVRLSVDF